MNTPMKRCNRCGLDLPATSEHFVHDRTKPDGFRTICKKCEKPKGKSRTCSKCQRDLIERHFPSDEWKSSKRVCFACRGLNYCPKCEQWKPATIEYFHADPTCGDGFRSWCRVCHEADRERRRPEIKKWRQVYYLSRRDEFKRRRSENYQQNKEYYKEYHRKYREEHKDKRRFWSKRRRRAQYGSYTSSDIKVLYRSQKGRCWWCGKPLNNVYHIDHRVPVNLGGSDNPENLCLACPKCNLSKSDKMPFEFCGRLL